MRLSEFLAGLTTPNVQLTLVDLNTSAEIASLKASGYACLDDAIEAREVKQWSITSATAIKAVIGNTETTEAAGEP